MALSSLRSHVRPTLLLAYPVVLSQVGHVLVSLCDSIVVGQLGKVPLAAISPGVSLTTVVMMLGLGLSLGITPLVAAAHGRHDTGTIGRLLLNGVVLCSLAGVLLAVFGWLVAPLLAYAGQAPEVVRLAVPWARIMFLSLVPLMVFQGFKQFAEGLGLTRQAMQLSVLANVVNALLCYALVFGRWGAPQLGMIGSAWATLIARLLMAALMAGYVLRASGLHAYRAAAGHWRQWSGHTMRSLLGIGLPIGVQMLFEVGAFGFSAIMVGWIGATAQAAHQIAITIASVTYMAASGIAAAATIRVGNLRGAGNMAGARHAGYTAYLLALAFMGSMGALLIAGRHLVPQLMTPDAAVRQQAAALLLIAALFQVSDGLQVVGLAALRGLEDVKVPSVVALLAYWAAALPLGYALGFGLGLGAMGIWLGLLVGLTLVAGVLLYRFGRRSRSGGPLQPAAAVNEPAPLLR